MSIRARISVAILVTSSLPASPQWLNYPSHTTPRTRDGKPNLSAPAPRVNGRPDLSGVWHVVPEPERARLASRSLAVPGDDGTDISKYIMNVLADFKPGESPLRPEAEAVFRARTAALGKDVPSSRCLPYGLPGELLGPNPFKLVQTRGLVIMLLEGEDSYRQIYTDGRPLPTDPQPSWRGYSVGRWDGDTFVVNTTGFNDRSWLDLMGHPHSDALQVEERFHRRDFGHMGVEVTIDDRKTFTRVFTIKFGELLMVDSDLIEYVCGENERDSTHFQFK